MTIKMLLGFSRAAASVFKKHTCVHKMRHSSKAIVRQAITKQSPILGAEVFFKHWHENNAQATGSS